jgi:hypothetical protein
MHGYMGTTTIIIIIIIICLRSGNFLNIPLPEISSCFVLSIQNRSRIASCFVSATKYEEFIHSTLTRFGVFMALKILAVVFWTVASCSDVVGYQCFRGTCSFAFRVKDGGNMVL